MRKRFLFALVSIYFCLSIGVNNMNAVSSDISDGVFVSSLSDEITFEQYNANIAGIEKVSPQQLETILQSDTAYYLYFGQSDCVFCRIFSSTLTQFKLVAPLPIYYVDAKYYASYLENETDGKLFKDNGITLTPMFLKVTKFKIIQRFVGSAVTVQQLKLINTEFPDQLFIK